MSFGRKQLFVSTIVAVLLIASIAATAGAFLSQYSLPGSADLKDVETRTLPTLSRDLSEKGLNLGDPIYIRVFKETSELEVWVKSNTDYTLFKTYPICAYSGLLGPKLKEGDKQSPEGFYKVTPSQMNPNSSYHLSFNIGFPNEYDRANGRTGSYLMVHGNCVSIGCYAMTDAGIEEIYLLANEAFKNGHSEFDVHIFPFRMSEENLIRHGDSEWLQFWLDLKEGYDAFEATRFPPKVEVSSGRYRAVSRFESSGGKSTDAGLDLHSNDLKGDSGTN